MDSLNPNVEGAKSGRNQLKAYTGQLRHVVVAAGEIIAEGNQKCRFVCADSEGIIKVGYLSDNGTTEHTEVKYLQAGTLWLVSNVVRVYTTYDGANPCTASAYTDAGALVVGIKLYF